jgi:hypothetical protein
MKHGGHACGPAPGPRGLVLLRDGCRWLLTDAREIAVYFIDVRGGRKRLCCSSFAFQVFVQIFDILLMPVLHVTRSNQIQTLPPS